jgi:hypothetical protein
MSLRLKLAAIASAMFLAVGAAVSFAAPAFAKDKQVMGVTDAAGGDQWAYTNSAAAGQEVNMANTDGPSPPSVAREHPASRVGISMQDVASASEVVPDRRPMVAA